MSLHPAVAACRGGVRRVLAQLERPGPIVVACSGGADSLALLSASTFEGRRSGRRVLGATVDHGLQPGSADQAQRVVQQMAALGVDETVSARVSVTATGIGPEAAARQARYDVLAQVSESFGAAVVLLGHTLDDQAETVLMGLTRGSGARSLQGMRRGFDGFARPLLDVSRDDTETACQVEGIDFWTDPHNSDESYTRVRVRRRVLPLLEDTLGPGVARTLARTADQVRWDVDYLDAVAADEHAAGDLGVVRLAALPTAIRRRVLRLSAVEAGAIDSELFYDHVVAIDALITDWHGQQWVDLPGHLRAVRRDDAITFTTHPAR